MKLNWRLIGLLFAATASAQMTTDMQPSGANFMQAMDVSMKRMDHDMAAALMTGDVDHDFAAMMIPHHQGAIDMAKGELRTCLRMPGVWWWDERASLSERSDGGAVGVD